MPHAHDRPIAMILPDDVEVRHVQPYEAVKAYRCPGCNHEISPGLGHDVVVPLRESDLRRHWHTPCWRAELRATARARRC